MEAPPAVISVFLGSKLRSIVDDISAGKRVNTETTTETENQIDLGIPTLPKLTLDSTDRNRTSPLAFVGNRFEFRAVGSSQNVAWPITAMNTIVAESLMIMCDEVERLSANSSPSIALQKVIRETLQAHKAIVFNDDCYDDEYLAEMVTKRGLPNISSAPESFELWNSEKNRNLFSLLNVMNEEEIQARGIVWAEHYCQVRAREARTLISMVENQVIPAAIKCQGVLAQSIASAEHVLSPKNNIFNYQKQRLDKIVEKIDEAATLLFKLKESLSQAPKVGHGGSTPDALKAAHYYHDSILTAMEKLRYPCDTLETLVEHDIWPFPSLSDICAFF